MAAIKARRALWYGLPRVSLTSDHASLSVSSSEQLADYHLTLAFLSQPVWPNCSKWIPGPDTTPGETLGEQLSSIIVVSRVVTFPLFDFLPGVHSDPTLKSG